MKLFSRHKGAFHGHHVLYQASYRLLKHIRWGIKRNEKCIIFYLNMCLQRICALCSNLPSGRDLLEVREKLLLRNLKRPTTLPFQKMGIGTNFKFVTLSIDSKASTLSGTVQIVKLCVTSLLLSSTGKANHILALEKLIYFSVDLL